MRTSKLPFVFKPVCIAVVLCSCLSVSASPIGLEVHVVPSEVPMGDTFEVEVHLTGDAFFATGDVELVIDTEVLEFESWSAGPNIIPFSSQDGMPATLSAPFTGNLPIGDGLLLLTANLVAKRVSHSVISFNTDSLGINTADSEFGFGSLVDLQDIDFTEDQVQVIVPTPGVATLLVPAVALLAGRRSSLRC